MDTLIISLLGLLLGGVVNALADDLPAGRMPSLPRYPDGCRRPPLAWLGITAFALRLREAPGAANGAAVYDDSPPGILSWRYPLVEVALSALMMMTFAVARNVYVLSLLETLIWLAFVALFVLIAVIDLEHRRILASPLLACALLASLRAIAFPHNPPTAASMLAGALLACLVFSLVYLGGRIFVSLAARTQRVPATAFGRGDVYLMTVAGVIVGFPQVLSVMALTILLGGIGALGCVLVMSASAGYRRFSAMPYAPFILASIYLVMLLRDELNRLIFGL